MAALRRFPSSLLSFFLGVSVSAYGSYYYLFDHHEKSTNALLLSVENLQTNTDKIKTSLQKIDTLEKKLVELSKVTAAKNDVESLRNELLNVVDNVRTEHLKLKVQVEELPLPSRE
ncbi:hypothetical protein HK098_005838 [Nowakowskiella sp. JEL0407]|nr:hypothetical protein HK098_005838 [Nowakowskiella sp. JEL0407]